MKVRTTAMLGFCVSFLAFHSAINAADGRSNIAMGRKVYRKACLTCHGARGDGNGPMARFLDPRPADFTRGQYKFRTTPSGELPTDDDLFRTVSKGIPGTQMPRWERHLTEAERWAVVQFIKGFSLEFEDEGPGDPIEISDPPPVTPQAIALGAEIYRRMKCAECHGPGGRGDGPAAATLRDDQARPMRAPDLTLGATSMKGGKSPQDIYRTVTTGLDGTPMPSYGASLTEEQRWQLVHFVQSLERGRGWFDTLFVKSGSWE